MIATAARIRVSAALVLALLLPALAVAFGWSLVHDTQRQWQPQPAIPLTFRDSHYRVPAEAAGGLREASRDYLRHSRQLGEVRLEEAVEQGVDELLDDVEARIPEFLDWYYSMSGEYSRLFWAGASAVGLSGGDYVAGRASETLFPDEQWQQGLQRMELRITGRIRQHSEDSREGWLAALEEMLRIHEVPAPLEDGPRRPAGTMAVSLDALAGELREEQTRNLQTRAGMATAAAGGVAAGPAIWRAVRQRAAATGARAAGARGAGRAAGRGATAAAGGATLCAPTGPAALGCALIAGAVTWVATDAALLKLDEALNRDELEQALRASLHELEESVREELIATYLEQLDAHYAQTGQAIERTLVPMERIRSG